MLTKDGIMRTLALIATAALAVALSPPATAVAVTPGAVGRYTPIARAAWPGSPCAGREQVTLAAVLPFYGDTADGMAYEDGSCRVVLLASLPDWRACIVLVHEFGHLAGRSHTSDAGIMDPVASAGWPACYAATADPVGDIASLLPPPRAAWRMTSGPRFGPHGRYQHVRASRPGWTTRRFLLTRYVNGDSSAEQF